ncbi:NAD(P)H-binding protein [Saccharomonospora sp. NPDC006951]
MRIIVFGATGNVGGRVVAEAVRRGHDVTAVVRSPERASLLPEGVAVGAVAVGDVSDPGAVAKLSEGHDVVVAATRPVHGREPELVAMTRALLAGSAKAGTRLVVVGGAAGLLVPGTKGRRVLDDPRYMSAEYRDIAVACLDQFAACAEADGDWTYASPPATLIPGRRTGRYRRGGDELVVDDEGASVISMEDFAVALLDEVEMPRSRQARFTAAY